MNALRIPLAGCLLVSLSLAASAPAAEPKEWTTDVCVVGAGSAGIGAALGAARAGAKVILVERLGRLGGTSANAYVSNWEPGPGGPVVREMYDRLRKLPHGVGITRDFNAGRKRGPFGLWMITPDGTYEQTLHRIGLSQSQRRAVMYDGAKLAKVARDMLDETGRCTVLLRTVCDGAAMDGRRVVGALVRRADGSRGVVRAKVFIDCTGEAFLCRRAGCEIMLGVDPTSRFHEPGAPEKASLFLNGIALCYRIRKVPSPRRQAPPGKPVGRFPHSAHVSEVPGGDLIVNPLALVPGRTLVELGYAKTLARAKVVAQAHWHWLQSLETFSTYEFVDFAPMLGIRESYRVLGEYVLTQQDVVRGLPKQSHPDMIAIADHLLDIHGGKGHRLRAALKGPYGIPYRCLVPKGADGLLVAGRCASFSHIAASSCRLNRTMTSLGRAAGRAAAMAVRTDKGVREIDIAALKKQLGDPAARK